MTAGIVSPMDNGAKDFDLRGHAFNQENTLDFMENLIQEKKNLYQEDEPTFVSELER